MSQVQPVGHVWRKSSRCDSNLCVEVALQGSGVAVRDNSQPQRHLTFDRASWSSLLHAIHTDQLHR